MEYTPAQRLARLWELIQKDPECMECFREMEQLRRQLEQRTDPLPPEDGQVFWALPMAQNAYFNRVLELVSRQMYLSEE